MSNMKDKMSALTAVFVEEVIASIASEMEAAFGGLTLGAPSLGKRAPEMKTTRGRKGAKRDPQALAELTDILETTIRAKPGNGIEQISKATGIPTKELALPVKKLLADGKITTTGQRRATKYFPGGKISRKKPKPRSASKKKTPSKKKASKKTPKKASKKK